MKTLHLFATTFLILGASASSIGAQKSKERVLATKYITGTTVGFEMGDYQHVEILLTNGKKMSFFIFKPGLDFFLAVHKESKLQLTYEIANVNIPESGGLMKVERLVSAKAGTVTYENWWKKMKAKHTMEQLINKYEPLVSKYQLNRN